jgi:HPt (histidine-containing phosphotransfer) domain-containing protein
MPVNEDGLARAIAEACPAADFEAREPATLGPTPATDLVFGRAEALKQLGGDDELLREIIEIFLSDFPELLTLTRNAVASHDPTALKRSAHVLVGTSAQLRATELADAARVLERLGATGDLDGADSALAALEDAFDRFRATVDLSAQTHPVTSAPSVDPVEKG